MTPERLALLEKAREKAQLLIQKREKLKNAPVPDMPKNTTTTTCTRTSTVCSFVQYTYV